MIFGTPGSLLWRLLMICKTTMLSHRALIVLPAQLWPQLLAAITLGINSLIVLCHGSEVEFHWSWNQSCSWKAPNSQRPDASEMRPLGTSLWNSARIETPFHEDKNLHRDHSITERKVPFRRSLSSIRFLIVERSIMRRMSDQASVTGNPIRCHQGVDSLCRDGADAHYMLYLSKCRITSPHTR